MRNTESLQGRLRVVEQKISDHPLSAVPVRQAFEVIERLGKENQEAVSRELRDRGLPGLDELGRLQLMTMASWWRLNRTRRRLRARLGIVDEP